MAQSRCVAVRHLVGRIKHADKSELLQPRSKTGVD